MLFRNELTHIFLPGEGIGRIDGPAACRLLRRASTSKKLSRRILSANCRSLQPLTPRTFNYEIQLPTQQELQTMGVTIQGPLHVHAQIN